MCLKTEGESLFTEANRDSPDEFKCIKKNVTSLEVQARTEAVNPVKWVRKTVRIVNSES